MFNRLKGNVSLFWWNIIVNVVGKSVLILCKIRCLFYRIAGMRTKTKNIRSGCFFRGKSIFIENDVLINHNVFIDGWEKVIIQEKSSIGFGVSIITSSHKIGDKYKRAGISERKPINIGKGCWIGANSIILPGVIIGDGCVIAAGSVVNKNCEANSLYAGIPAKKIRNL